MDNRVNGHAQVGDLMKYEDMANQDGTVWEVIRLNDAHEWSQYTLINLDAGIHYSDLRQRGWTFVQKVAQ